MKSIDPHFHLWDLVNGVYPWLQQADEEPEANAPGQIRMAGLRRNYLIDDYLADTAGLEIVKGVHIDAKYDESDPVGETRWLQSVADAPASRGFPQGIVGYVDLSRDNAEEIVAGHAAHRNFRGVRQILNQPTRPGEPDYLTHPAWRRNFGILGRYEASFDLQIFHHQMPAVVDLARKHPYTQIILNHAGMPTDLSPEGMRAWREDMDKLAACPNVSAKISGIGMSVPDLDDDAMRPIIEATVDAFGVDRVMFASNFPVDGLFSSFRTLWERYLRIAATWTETEREKMFYSNAERIYRI